MKQMKTIKIQNLKDDLRDYYHYWAFSTEPGKSWIRNLFIISQGIYIVIFLLVWGFSNSIWLAVGFFLVFELGLLIRTKFKPRDWLANKRIDNYLKDVGDSHLDLFTQPKQLKISNERIHIRNQDWSSSISWKIIQNIESSSDSIFIHYGFRSILIIPKRSFDSNNEFDSFYKELCEKVQKRSPDQFPNTMDAIFN